MISAAGFFSIFWIFTQKVHGVTCARFCLNSWFSLRPTPISKLRMQHTTRYHEQENGLTDQSFFGLEKLQLPCGFFQLEQFQPSNKDLMWKIQSVFALSRLKRIIVASALAVFSYGFYYWRRVERPTIIHHPKGFFSSLSAQITTLATPFVPSIFAAKYFSNLADP